MHLPRGYRRSCRVVSARIQSFRLLRLSPAGICISATTTNESAAGFLAGLQRPERHRALPTAARTGDARAAVFTDRHRPSWYRRSHAGFPQRRHHRWRHRFRFDVPNNTTNEAAARANRRRARWWLIEVGSVATNRFRCRAVASSSRLEDAGNYITPLPKAEHEAAEWQAAMEALILVATRDQ
jgi:hypothetical protein